MRNITAKLLLMSALALTGISADAQVLNLSINKLTPGNIVQVLGTASSPGFTSGAATSWGAMGITLRIPKSVTSPAPTNTNTGTVATNITSVSTAFTGATPADAFTGTTGLSAFDLTAFGQPDDGNWYFQITETTPGGMQSIASGASVVVYQFTVPNTWLCSTACLEIVQTQVSGLPISTIPFIDNSATGGNVISVIQGITPLPISLLDFTAAKTTDGRVQLNWQTSSEQGSDYFEAERSGDGKVFDKRVAHVKAAGKSSTALNYQSYDVAPLSGDNFYRLKMVGVDGKYTYSAVRKVSFHDVMADVIVYPTDNVDGTVHVKLPKTLEGAEIYVVDAVGRKLPVSVEGAGEQRSLSLRGLAAGAYMLQVVNEGISKSFKITYHP